MIDTLRLRLRHWRPDDAAPFAALHADADVMRWLGRDPFSHEEALSCLDDCRAHFSAHGYGLWAVERRADRALIGLCGLRRIDEAGHPLDACTEIAWRQSRSAWGQGYMAEAAGAALMDGFVRLGMEQVTSATAHSNVRSQRLMARIGMLRRPERDFDHPALPEGHDLRAHVVYTIDPQGWMERLATSARCA